MELPTNTATLTFGFSEDWFDTNHRTEDGTMIHGYAFCLIAETEEGYRWRRNVDRALITVDEEGLPHADTEKADRLRLFCEERANRLNQTPAPRLNRDEWYFVGAAYGSSAYGKLDEFMLMDNEERLASRPVI